MGACRIRTDVCTFSYNSLPGFSLCFKGKVEKPENNKNMNYPRQLER